MNSWIPKNKIITFASTIAVISTLLYFAGLFIVLQGVKEIENIYRDTESKSAKEKRALVVKSIALTNKEYIQTLREFFVQKGDEVKFIEQIEKIGKESSVQSEIISIEVKTKESDSLKEDVVIAIKMAGSWQSVMTFLDMLEKAYFGVSIKNLKLSSNVPGEWFGSVDFILFREK